MKINAKIRIMLYSLLLWAGHSITTGCSNRSERLEAVLKYSGNNREELEKVLEHYSHTPEDSLKLKAAIFLIENMPGHYTYSGPFLDKYYARLDTVKDTPYHEKKLLQTIPFDRQEYRSKLQIREDVKYIRAEFLIHQIDLAFRQWETLPWMEGVDFEMFKEYILPYRVDNETLDNWRDSIAYFLSDLYYYQEYCEDCRYSVTGIQNKFHAYINNLKSKIPETAFKDFKLDCIPLSKLTLFTYRIIGIPAVIDYTPHFANRNGRHHWITGIDPNLNNYEVFQANLYRMAKIYRRTFSHNPTPIPHRDEYIPPCFLNPFHKDVTSAYMPTTDISVPIPRNVKIEHAYLAVFNDLTWKPIACSKVSGRQAYFPDMGRDIVYLPVYYKEDEMLPLAPPFIVSAEGSISRPELSGSKTKKLKLKRKYPGSSTQHYWFERLKKARIEASNEADFNRLDTIYQFRTKPTGEYRYITVDSTLKRRYWRFIIPGSWVGYLADLRFYDREGHEIQGQTMHIDSLRAQALFDDSPLTYSAIYSWIGLDFGRPVGISRIRYLPRNDANGIYPGNEYELLYYRFPEGWTSLGIKSPEGYEIEYDQVPSGGLYWLRNLTCGQEERIFTWENGEARFW